MNKKWDQPIQGFSFQNLLTWLSWIDYTNSEIFSNKDWVTNTLKRVWLSPTDRKIELFTQTLKVSLNNVWNKLTKKEVHWWLTCSCSCADFGDESGKRWGYSLFQRFSDGHSCSGLGFPLSSCNKIQTQTILKTTHLLLVKCGRVHISKPSF